MTTELSTTLVQQINAKHAEARDYAKRADDHLLATLNAVREVGILLEDAKSSLGHTGWKAAQGEFDFNDKQAQLYLTFARKNPQPITDIKVAVRAYQDAQLALGLEEFPEGHGSQRSHEPNLYSTMFKDLTRFNSEWQKMVARKPVEEWPRHEVEQFVDGIEPMVERVNSIFAEARAQLAEGD